MLSHVNHICGLNTALEVEAKAPDERLEPLCILFDK